ncbi:hypothetical protein KKH43_05020 [Patescibacteria group bacterium]|nr:hypothetical protein [Patescibacteria group bacterium]
MFVAFFGLTLVGLLTGHWWFLIGYGAFMVVLFPAIEFKVLCSRCPYYSKCGKKVVCFSGSGVPKTYKSNLRPMTKAGHAVMYSYYTFTIGFPIVILSYAVYYTAHRYEHFGLIALMGIIGLLVAQILTFLAFNYCLGVYVCRRCPNFSCPWNGVKKPVVDEYLRMNPEMRKKWEETGYVLGDGKELDDYIEKTKP